MDSPATDVVLVYLETSSNQNFIFGTNKLRENIGASEMSYRAGTKLVADAVNDVFFSGVATVPFDPGHADVLRRWIEQEQPAIEEGTRDVEIVIATSGKSILLVRTEAMARSFISAWSRRLTTELPGVDGVAVYSTSFSMASAIARFGDTLTEVHRRFDKARVERPSPERRFMRLPIAAACSTSGAPASHALRYGRETRLQLLSETSWRKRTFAGHATDRFVDLLGIDDPALVKNLDVLERMWGCEWIAVVHADGNGLGQIFLQFAQHVEALGGATARDYVSFYRQFSHEIDRATLRAFRIAARTIPSTVDPSGVPVLPVLPIVVGGDDLTVVCGGERALGLTVEFLNAFEREISRLSAQSALARVLCEAFGTPRLGMCAGVAIVKPHFPFFRAYGLAEELVKSAKAVKERVKRQDQPVPSSAVDFHIVYDSTVVNLESIREQLDTPAGIRLYAKPFVTTPIDNLGELEQTSSSWVVAHHWKGFEAVSRALRSRSRVDEGNPALPNSQAHAIRSLLRQSARVDLERTFLRMCQKYATDGFQWPEETLCFRSPETPDFFATRFQDGLEALHFLPTGEGDRNGTPVSRART